MSDRNSLAVVADISAQSEDLISNFNVEPNPFTPNDDGINDAMTVIFDVQRLLVPKAVHLEIYDLNGRRVHRTERQLASGGYSQQWDGLNDAGQRVPPGLYILSRPRAALVGEGVGHAQTREGNKRLSSPPLGRIRTKLVPDESYRSPDDF